MGKAGVVVLLCFVGGLACVIFISKFFQMYRTAAPPAFMPTGQPVGDHDVKVAQMSYPGVSFIT